VALQNGRAGGGVTLKITDAPSWTARRGRPPGSISVLVVDDSVLFGEGVARILEADGRFMIAGQAAHGSETVRVAARVSPDVIIMDPCPVPGQVADTLHLIRTRLPELSTRVLIIIDGDRELPDSFEAESAGYLSEDCTQVELCDAAEAVAHGRAQLPPPPSFARAKQRGPGIDLLTARELEVLRALATGASYGAISENMSISPKTLRNHISSIYRKLQIFDRAQAAITAIREGLV
jgi:DNA-binding NarL/FixJ family response regulator